MKVNITKCTVIHCSRLSTLQYSYNINHQPQFKCHRPTSLSWCHNSQIYVMGITINTIVLKASRTLNFIKRNLYMCSKEVTETAYFTLVRLCLEYAFSVWDPYQLYLISNIEKTKKSCQMDTFRLQYRNGSVSNTYVETIPVVLTREATVRLSSL